MFSILRADVFHKDLALFSIWVNIFVLQTKPACLVCITLDLLGAGYLACFVFCHHPGVSELVHVMALAFLYCIILYCLVGFFWLLSVFLEMFTFILYSDYYRYEYVIGAFYTLIICLKSSDL